MVGMDAVRWGADEQIVQPSRAESGPGTIEVKMRARNGIGYSTKSGNKSLAVAQVSAPTTDNFDGPNGGITDRTPTTGVVLQKWKRLSIPSTLMEVVQASDGLSIYGAPKGRIEKEGGAIGACAMETKQPNGTISIEYDLGDAYNRIGLIFRMKDTNNFWRTRITGSSLLVARIIDGVVDTSFGNAAFNTVPRTGKLSVTLRATASPPGSSPMEAR